jgi:signal transduction histidine kinase
MSNSIISDRLLKINFDIITIFLEYKDWYDGLQNVFELVGNEISVDRIYYWDIHKDYLSDDELTSQRFEWVKSGVEPMIDNPELQNLPIGIASEFMAPLLKKKPFKSIIKDLPDGMTKDILQSQDIISILVLPIYIDNKLFGFIGFDDCTKEREWNNVEINFLRSITSNLSSAIQRRIAILKLEQKTHDLKLINSELEQFAYIASHDLQEPLRMVTGFLGLFEKKYKSLVDEKGKEYINYAVDGTTRMKKIIQDLLDYSRVGKTKDSIEIFELKELIDNISLLYSEKIKEKKAEIILITPIKIQTWKSPLTQVLINLLDNSLKYSKNNIPVRIEIEPIDQTDNWYIKFTDNGIGIDERYFSKIFIIFQRLHNKEDYSGTGIGLAITKKIIENLGGKIWVTSKKDEGSTFHLSIPKIK